MIDISVRILVSILYVITGLMTLNWTYIIYRLYINNCQIKGLIARSPKSVVIAGFMSSVYCIIILPYNLNVWSGNEIYWIYEFIGLICIYLFGSTPQMILLCRTFNVYFQLKYNIHKLSNIKCGNELPCIQILNFI